ncbi:MAG: flagellar motor switch protein FliM, partial [Oceanicoccus sp.]
GDVITIDIPDKLVLTANNVPVLHAKLGTSKGNLALQVIEKIKRD